MFTHLCTTRGTLRRAFPQPVLDAIEAAIGVAEREHSGELRFAVETALDLSSLLRGVSARQRAIETFSCLHVWDTEANNGVLIYVLLAEQDIEIVADRGYNGRVDAAQWEAVCDEMKRAFQRGEFEAGSLLGIRRISQLIAELFPSHDHDVNELPNRPALL